MDSDFSRWNDESLLNLIKEGVHAAFAELMQRHSNRFYRIAYRVVFSKEEAEDIVQEAFLRLWERPQLWNPRKQAKFTTWFYKVVINMCLDHNKKKKPVPFSEDIDWLDRQPPGENLVLSYREKQVLLDRLIKELPKRQQLALNLCFYEGLRNEEAAEIMGSKVKALQSLIMRAKITLKEKVKQYFD